MRCNLLVLLAASVALAADPAPTSVALWPDPLIADLAVSGRGAYADPDGDPFARGEYRFVLGGEIQTAHSLPTGLVLNADGTAWGEGLHVPAESTGIAYTDGVWGSSFDCGGDPRLRFSGGPLGDAADGAVDFWFRLHYDLSDSIYAGWRVFFWLETGTGDLIYVETYVNTIYGSSYSGGQYAGAWTGSLDLHAGDWHHFLYGWHAADSLAVVFIDGQQRGLSTTWPGVSGATVTLYVGNGPWGGHSALADIDAIRVWTRLPSRAEVAWAAASSIAPSQCSAMLDSVVPVGTTVQYQVRVADVSGAWSDWVASAVDSLRASLIDTVSPPPRLAAHDASTLPLEVHTSVPCQCRASETTHVFAEMTTALQTADGLMHTSPWPIDPADEFHEVAVRCSSLAGDIDPDLVRASTGYRQLKPYDPPYPRPALLWGNYDPELGLGFFSNYALIITGSWSGFTGDVQRSLRALNPDLKILTTGHLSYGGPPMDEWAALTDPADPHFDWVLRDPAGNVILESYWGHAFYNLTDSSCVAWLVDYNVAQWRATGLTYDGVYFDRVHDFISFISDDIDADQNGVADDPAVLDSLWSDGMEYYLQRFRAELPNEVICGNDTPLHFGPYINGRLFEMGLAYIMDEDGEWMPFFDEYRQWEAVHREPHCLPIVCNQAPLDFLWRWGLNPQNSVPPDSVEWVRTRYQRMRFGLGTALLSEGVSVYDFGTTWWGNPWWYDEYDVNLGYPTGVPHRITDPSAIVATEDFETGTEGIFNLNQWGPMWAEITDDPGEVISGAYSLKGGNDTMGQTWNEFAHSNRDSLPLSGDSTYTVTFTYKVLTPPPPTGYFYFFARSVTGGVASDVGGYSWQGAAGATDTVTVTFRLESYPDYYLVFGLKYTGECAIDDIEVAAGGGGLWKRDFDHGAVVVNPARMPQTADLGDTLCRFLGAQDPVHNNGQPVRLLTLQGHDAILLLSISSGIMPPGPLTITPLGTDALLQWGASPGASGYHVYRDVVAWFVPSPATRLTLVPQTGLTYTDPVVLGDPANPVFYTVRALSSAGTESAPSNRVGSVSVGIDALPVIPKDGVARGGVRGRQE